MAQVSKISSFKSFTEVKNQEATMKLRETNNAKRQETVGKIGAILDEMGLTSLSELDEVKKQALINKMFGNVSEDEAEDIEDELNKLGEPKKLEEGNAFIFAASKAKQDGKTEFEFNGKKYKVTIKKDTGLKEGNAFGDAVKKAKEDGEDEFEFDGETYKVEESIDEAKRTKFTGKTAHDLYTQTGGKPFEVFVKNDWYSVDPAELKDSKEDSFTGYTKDGSDYGFDLKDIDFIQESLVTEGKHGMAKKLLKAIVNGDSTEAEGIKLSKDLADHYLNWINTSPYGKKNENLPLYMLINASFNWGIERGLDPKLKKELADLKAAQKKNESVESIDEARSISKIQYDWSKLTTSMQATAQNWKAAEGPAKESLLGKLKEMTAQKKALEAELDAAIADKDKDLELVVSEAFFRLPKDIIGNELYLATQNLSNLYGRTLAGNDIDTGVIDTVIKALTTVKKSVKKFNSKEEVLGTVYEAENFKSTKDFLDFLEEIDGMPENRIKRIMGKDYIDTPGGFRDEADDYDNDIEEYTRSNMGTKDFEKLRTWWENNVAESVVNEAAAKQFDVDFNNMVKNIKSGYGWIDPEFVADTWENSSDSIDFELVKGEIYKRLIAAKLLAFADDEDEETAGQYVKSLKELGIKESVVNEAEVQSDDEFKEYAMAVLKKAFGDEFDEAKAGEVVDGILKKCGDDYGACVGMLTSSLGESVVTEREETQIGTHRYQGKSYPLYTDDEHNHYIKVNGRIIEVDESFVVEGFDANYWEDYHDGASKIKNPGGMQLQQIVSGCVEDWNDNNEMGEENEVTSAGEKKVLKLAKEFVKAKGWISDDVIDAMIAQES